MTTAQRLAALVKSCRDIMRKDKGLNGDLDRLPMLTWIMFLKFLDDMERVREDEAIMQRRPARAIIEMPYRWRDWNPANGNGADDGLHAAMTGDALIAFVNQDEALRPDGTRGAGLFAYLRSLQGGSEGSDRRDVVANVFNGTVSRIQSGYLLRDVLDQVNTIHFSASDEIHTLGRLYESMLKEMRDAAGDSGEFYTPRAVVQMVVRGVNPQPGEIVLDPAAGTGGFLVEAYDHLAPACNTVDQARWLQRDALFGIEAKSLPYLLCQMNLLLHGVEVPNIDSGNALRFRMSEIGDRDRVDVIITNPPFGGEEEKGIQGNFPDDRQTSETALLFLQLIMRKLRRPGHEGKPGGRAGVVVPNGILSGGGVAARIKSDLLENYNLHTVVRLPNGVFAPYTAIPTNVLFFDRSSPTSLVWFYDHPLPQGRNNYTKTQPLHFEEFGPLFEWWSDRAETPNAWRVPVDQIKESGFNLDLRNPNTASESDGRGPSELLDGIMDKEREILKLVAEVDALCRSLVADTPSGGATLTAMSELVELRSPDIEVDDDELYRFAGVYSFGRGVFKGPEKRGSEFSYRRLSRVHAGDFIYPKLMAWEGALGVIPIECDGLVVSPEFPVFTVDTDRVLPDVLDVYFRTPAVWPRLAGSSRGTNVRRRRLHPQVFLAYEIPLPPMSAQRQLSEIRARFLAQWEMWHEAEAELSEFFPALVRRAFAPD